jgi:lipoyl-dependent peroxiredoxin
VIATGSSTWSGPWREGSGTLSTASGALAGTAYTYASRFEESDGVAPEELLAAAYAGCLNQAFARTFGWAGCTPELIETTVEVEVHLGSPTPGELRIRMRARVPGLSADAFSGLAGAAKAGCLVSRVLGVEAAMETELLEEQP